MVAISRELAPVASGCVFLWAAPWLVVLTSRDGLSCTAVMQTFRRSSPCRWQNLVTPDPGGQLAHLFDALPDHIASGNNVLVVDVRSNAPGRMSGVQPLLHLPCLVCSCNVFKAVVLVDREKLLMCLRCFWKAPPRHMELQQLCLEDLDDMAVLVSQDVEKFFDSIDHEVMLRVLRRLHAPEPWTRLVANFYSQSRRHFLVKGCVGPDWHRVRRGVLQGWPFSPMIAGAMMLVWTSVVCNPNPREGIDGCVYIDDRSWWPLPHADSDCLLRAQQRSDLVDRALGLVCGPSKSKLLLLRLVLVLHSRSANWAMVRLVPSFHCWAFHTTFGCRKCF